MKEKTLEEKMKSAEDELDEATKSMWKAWLKEQKPPFPDWMYAKGERKQ